MRLSARIRRLLPLIDEIEEQPQWNPHHGDTPTLLKLSMSSGSYDNRTFAIIHIRWIPLAPDPVHSKQLRSEVVSAGPGHNTTAPGPANRDILKGLFSSR